MSYQIKFLIAQIKTVYVYLLPIAYKYFFLTKGPGFLEGFEALNQGPGEWQASIRPLDHALPEKPVID